MSLFVPGEHRWVASCRLGARAQWASQLAAGAAEGDVVELRLDGLDAEGWKRWLAGPSADSEWADELEGCRVPVLLTVRDRDTFGHFAGTPAEKARRLADLANAGWSIRALDVDLTLLEQADTAGLLAGWPAGLERVVSEHGQYTDRASAGARLAQLFACAAPDELVKLALAVDDARDGLELLDVAAEVAASFEGRPWTAFAIGARGSATRLLAPSVGAAATYAPPAGLASTAPGQSQLAELQSAFQGGDPRTPCGFAGVLGAHVGESLSPALHSGALARAAAGPAGHAATEAWSQPPLPRGLYVRLESADPDGLMARLRCARWSSRWRGLSVTAPHKGWALGAAERADALATAAGAANTLLPSAEGPTALEAWNTDALAVQELLAAARPPAGAVCVIGAGGAARAAVLAARTLGHPVRVQARRAVAARALVESFEGQADEADAIAVAGPGDGPFAAVVHATPQGGASAPDVCPELPVLVPGAVVIDAAYGAGTPPLAAEAFERGARYIDGRRWLSAQASRQFEGFFPAAAHALASAGGRVGRPGPGLSGPTAAEPSGVADPDPRPLVFLGLRGSGKSTLAPLLATRLGRAWFDADAVLAWRARREPDSGARFAGSAKGGALEAGQVLAAWGEPRFRQLEETLWAEWLSRGGSPVIAAGGGAVESARTRHLLRHRARCIWLDIDPQIAAQRVDAEGAPERPRLAGRSAREEAVKLAARRKPWFEELAWLRLDRLRRSPDALVDEIVLELGQLGAH
ncbi:MAG: type I 3-dehydroquinate dehydratase [Planctomycetota bacterium]